MQPKRVARVSKFLVHYAKMQGEQMAGWVFVSVFARGSSFMKVTIGTSHTKFLDWKRLHTPDAIYFFFFSTPRITIHDCIEMELCSYAQPVAAGGLQRQKKKQKLSCCFQARSARNK